MSWGLVALWCVCACLNAQLEAQLVTSNPGFNDRFLKARDKLNYSLNNNARDSGKMEMDLRELWSDHSSAVSSEVLRCRGHTMLISGDQVSKLSPQGVALSSDLPIPRLFPRKQLRFSENIEYHKQLYLLMCYTNNQCILFSSMEFQFIYRQTISDSGVPIDAKFFIQRDSLFLIVLYQARDSYVSQSRLYRWHKTSMDGDGLAPEMTSTARSLTVFEDQENIIIVLACVGDERIKFPSQVWMREPSGALVKVHNLATVWPLSITHFVQREQHFLLVLQKVRQPAVYWWEGKELVLWIPVDEDLNQYNVSISTVMGMPFMVFTQGTHLKICIMTSVKLENVYEQNNLLTRSPYAIQSITRAVMYEDKDVFMFIQGLDGNGITHKFMFRVKMGNLHIDRLEDAGRTQGWSLDLLLSSVDALGRQADYLAELMSSVLLTNMPAATNTTVIAGVAVVQNGNVGELLDSPLGVFNQKQKAITALSIVRGQIDECNEKLESIKDEDTRHLVFHKDVHFYEANINSLTASTVNRDIFKPESYLSLTGSQRLREVHASKLKVQWLVLNHIGNSSIKDLLLEDRKISVPLKTNGLELKHLHTRTGNDAIIDKLINAQAIPKEYEDGTRSVINDQEFLNLHLPPDTVIEDLYVDNINDISFSELLNVLFIPYLNNTIKGDVTFEKGFRVDQLVTNDLRVTPHLEKLHPIRPMPLDPEQPLVVQPHLNPFPQAPTVYTPQPSYILPHAYPYNPLYAYPYSPAQAYPHSYYSGVGKRYARQAQKNVKIMKSKVKILGNLKAKRIIFKNSSLTTINGTVPTSDLDKTFWTKNITQVIPEPVYFRNGVSLLNGLDNPIINGKNLSRFSHKGIPDRQTKRQEEIDAKSNHKSFGHTDKESQDKHMKIIEVKHLHAKYINGISASKILSSYSLSNGKIMVTTANLIVKADLTLDTINDINLKEKLDLAVMSDEDTKLGELNMKNITARSIKVSGGRSRREERVLRLRGDIALQSLIVSSVNNKSADLSLVVNKTKNTVILGNKTFNSQVQVKSNMVVNSINDKNISGLLLKSKNQVITGFYTVMNAKFVSLSNVSSINGQDPKKFAYIDQPLVNISKDIAFNSIHVVGNITASSLGYGCNLPTVDGFGRVVFSGPLVAPFLKVGSAHWPGTDGRLSRLLRSAVTLNTEQTITGSVTFSRLFANDIQVDTLKGKNISFLFEDSLMIGKDKQVITGKKHFTGVIKCQNVEVKNGARFSKVNKININDIDSRLVRLTADGHSGTGRILGKKTFMSGFTAFNLTCEGGVNGIQAEILARDSGPVIPALSMRSLTVLADLKAGYINGLHVDNFVHDIIYLNHNPNTNQVIGDSLIIMGNVTFKGNLHTRSINNISTDELVFMRRSDKLTHIKGCKKFSNIHIETNSTVDYLNSKLLVKFYNKSIKLYQNITINGSLELFDVDLASVFANEYFVNNRKLLHLNKTLIP